MPNRKTWLVLSALSLTAVATFIVNCGSSSDDATSSSYQGLGSKWSATFNSTDKTFTVTYDAQPDGTADMTVNGTYVEHANKFKTLTVTSATGTNAPSPGGTGIGLEIPGYAFFLKPMGGNGEPIVMIKSGACPSADFTANWVIAKFQDSASTPTASSDALGTADFALSAKTATINQRRFDTGAALSSNSITLKTCDAGTQTFDDGSDANAVMYLTSNGGALVNPGNGIIFASPQLSADPTSSDWNGTYSGFAFTETNSTSPVFPAKITLSGTSGTGVKITDVSTDAVDSSGVTLGSIAALSGTKGLLHGTVTTSGGANPLNCVFTQVEGSKVLACNGADGDASGGVYQTFFFLGVAR